MTYDTLKYIKSNNPTIKLLNSDNFAFMLSFFYQTFVKNRYLTMTHTEILSFLDDYLFDINSDNDHPFPKTAKQYLDDFAHDNNGYLRKYHGQSDEPLYELTPHSNKALEFLESLEKSEFIASRSKFNIIFELLEDLEFETQMDDTQRIQNLEEQKKEIDRQIFAIKDKKDLRFDTARIKEHYMQIDEMIRKLKYDFSQMEYNFRALNILAMEEIALKEDEKNRVLETIFDIEDKIREGDQGKSFFAFWQLLTDTKKSQRFNKLLKNLYEIEAIALMDKEQKHKDVSYTLLKSAEKIYMVSAKLIEQLRRFVDDRVWIENRRVLALCRGIEKKAIEIRENQPTQRHFFDINGEKVSIDSIFNKRLYAPKEIQVFNQEEKENIFEIDMQSFYSVFHVDESILKRNISKILAKQTQCTLKEISQDFPFTKGMSELIAYISIAKNSEDAFVDKVQTEIILADTEGVVKSVTLPNIIFSKGDTI